jgi:DNA-binding response OmpR family regulator
MHILHLEDDPNLLKVVQFAILAILPDAKFVQYDNSTDAFEYINENATTLDVLVLDIGVPGIYDGVQLAQHVRALNTRCRIVMTSAYDRPNDRVMRDYKLDWMPKPLEMPIFRAYLQDAT